MDMIPPRPVYPTACEQDELIPLDRSLIADEYGLDYARHREMGIRESSPLNHNLEIVRSKGSDISWFEQFWYTLRSGVSTLWNALSSGMNWIFGFHTPAVIPTHLSDEGQRLMESLTMMVNAGKITLGFVAYAMEPYTSSDESVEIDYEQPQPMYPELPEQ